MTAALMFLAGFALSTALAMRTLGELRAERNTYAAALMDARNDLCTLRQRQPASAARSCNCAPPPRLTPPTSCG